MSDWSPPRTPSGQVSRVPHLPGLDGLRAIAVLAVVVYHANSGWLHGGFLGVEVFFVISGYLITLLLIAEHERSGSVDLKQFWLRRARRLLPALFVMLGLLMLYLAIFKPEARGRTRGDIYGGVGYVSNWYQIWVGAGYTASEAFAPLRHLWSLAVEEQFYLIWPLVMIAILRRGRANLPRVGLWLFGVAVAITAIVAVFYVPGDINSTCTPDAHTGYWIVADRCISINDTLYLSTITRAGGLMLGSAFAMVWRPVAIMRSPMRDRGRQLDVLALLGMVLLAWLVWTVHLADPALNILTGSRFDPLLFRGGLFLTGIATLAVIAAVTHQRAMTGVLLGTPVLSWVGTRSYGLYLYHWPIYQIIRQEAGIKLSVWEFLVAMVVTLPITELSYRYIETPVRRGAIGAWLRGSDRRRASRSALTRRRQLAAMGVVAAIAFGWASVGIVLAPNRCVGVVECASEAGAAAIEAQTTSTTLPRQSVESVPLTAPPGETLAPTTAAPTTAPPTTLPPADRQPIAIGESVMLGATNELQTGGFFVNAAVSRQGDALAEVIGQYRASGQIGKVIVIQVGTNGPVSDATFDLIMSFLPPEEVEQVVFLTVTAPGKGYIDDNNARIWAQTKHANVIVGDWAGLVANDQVPGLAGDGIHLRTAAAKQFYANYIFEWLGRRDLVVLPLPE
jgi:peptidoglycan/LPS O-acetylase OafA/YrhL